ncbi:hypothetical protein BMS3Abin05_02274 [bacterium BMS3Abin05]|nr:hypothetical protein BMS3Abin05_02274 [bacterium BMS3Abin05]GBE27616.1 hypothetical protein BMS3Bbin03_01544 [bacterium BMS3Bbin03]HDK35417.1 hypothetical protein [Bacteroidota bacterium]HDL78715.1 hypothetical protein [Bacteroidota bacterium]HDZ10918.1 hypothetical protein [Bacteroidota bacterium]
MSTREEIQEERKKMRHLRWIVDLTVQLLYQEDVSVPEMLKLVEATKRHVLTLFPDKEFQFELIYRPRFNRIIQERLQSN